MLAAEKRPGLIERVLGKGKVRIPALVAALVTVALHLAGVSQECADAVRVVLLGL